MSTKTVKIKVKYDGSEASKGTKKTAAEFEEVNKKTTLLSQGIEKTGKEFKRLSRATKISKESLLSFSLDWCLMTSFIALFAEYLCFMKSSNVSRDLSENR